MHIKFCIICFLLTLNEFKPNFIVYMCYTFHLVSILYQSSTYLGLMHKRNENKRPMKNTGTPIPRIMIAFLVGEGSEMQEVQEIKICVYAV